MLSGPQKSDPFEEGAFLAASGETSSGPFLLTSLASEVAATRRLQRTNLAPAVTTGNLETHGGDVSFGSIFVTESLVASSAGPLLCLLVEERPSLTADVSAHCAD